MFSMLIYLIVAGLALYILGLLPIDDLLKKIIRAIVITIICVMLIYFLIDFLPNMNVPRLR